MGQKVARNEDGVFEIQDVGAATKAPSDLQVGFFEDDAPTEGGKRIYSTFVLLGGYKVYINELSRADFKEWRQRENALQGEYKAVNKLIGLPNIAEHAEEIEKRSDNVLSTQIALQDWVIEQAVVDWDVPSAAGGKKPYTPESRLALRPSHRAELAEKITQKSMLGKVQKDF